MDVSTPGALRTDRQSPFQYGASAFVFLLTLVGSHLATPLYPHWQQEFGLSTTQITIIFSCYPVSVTFGLLYGGRLGDQFGRKPLMLAGILLTIMSSLLYLAATGMMFLVAARIVNGLAVGLMTGPAVAALVELQPNRNKAEASRISAMITLSSPALGLLVSTTLVYLATTPAQSATWPFLAQLVGLAAALSLLFVFRETILSHNRRSVKTASYRPLGLAVPASIRRQFAFAAIGAVLCWGITGLWLALGPTLVYEVLKSSNRFLGGFVVVAFLASAGVAQLFARNLRYRRAIFLALVLVPPTLGLIIVMLFVQSSVGLVLCTIILGISQGLLWMGCAELMNDMAPPDTRASVISAIYVCGYFGSSIPLIVTGIAADRFGLFAAVTGLSVLLAAMTLGLLVTRRVAIGVADGA